MYRHETSGGCGCGGSSPTMRANPGRGRKLGRIDETGQCVCDECDACGLTCLCRPRFFDGQLITAADFRRLDQYIVAKSRLHNKYLHGVGVVCGLEAVCSPCEDTVTVRAGYALGNCGEDIVVCSDAKVDLKKLIMEQRAAAARSDCAPYSEPTKDSEAARQRWVLSICYDETPSRPVTSLKRSGGGCGCGGSCGGSSGGGCGCGGSCSSGPSTPANCEPTQICEGYRFTLTKFRPEPRRTARLESARNPDRLNQLAPVKGDLPGLVMDCLRRLSTGLSQLPEKPSNDELVDYARDLKEELRELIETGNVHDCTLAQRLFDIPIPDPQDDDADVRARAAVTAMLQIAVDLFRECVCSALLPKCAEACEGDCVPLAVVTVRSSDLQVLDICNWSARQFAITMPTLQYWLGWIPVFGALREALVRLCCGQSRTPGFGLTDTLRVRETKQKAYSKAAGEPAAAAPGSADVPPAGAPAPRSTAYVPPPAEPAAFVALASQYRETWSSLSGLEATVLGALGARSSRGAPLATSLELDNPLAALTLGHLGVGAAASLLPPDLASRVAAGVNEPAAAAKTDRIAILEESLTKLTRTVNSQARTIRTLKEKGGDT